MTRLRIGQFGVRIRSEKRGFSVTQQSRLTPGLKQPPIQWVPGFFFVGYEVHHSTPSSAVVKNEWSHTSTPPICLHGADSSLFDDVSRSDHIGAKLCRLYTGRRLFGTVAACSVGP